MGVLEYLDNDVINRPDAGTAEVFHCQDSPLLGVTKAGIIKRFPEVFSEDVGKLEGLYHIKIDPTVRLDSLTSASPSVRGTPKKVKG